MLVNDANGNPVSGVSITASLVPIDYYKGLWTPGSAVWIQTTTAGPCLNEDLNRNGILDLTPVPSEDNNGNGSLEPGNVVSVLLVNGGITDASGFASVSLIYAQWYAYWVRADLEVRANVSGSEAVKSVQFFLEGAATDFNNLNVSPPGHPSPFGVSATCFNIL